MFRGTTSVWLVQVSLMGLQFAYTAVTGRILTPAAFGTYAVAVTTVTLANLIVVAGFSKASARRLDESSRGDRALITASLLSAAAVALLIVLLSGFFSALWEAPAATELIVILALALPFAAYAAVLLGVLRRQGKLRQYNTIVLIAGVTSICAGIVAVGVLRTATALVVLSVVQQVVAASLAAAVLRGRSRPSRDLAGVGTDVKFSLKSSATSLVVYSAFALPLVVLGRSAGPAVLGAWNRATTLTQVPVESVTGAVATTLFPRLRGAAGGTAGRRQTWTDMASLAALIVVPMVMAFVPAVPSVIFIVLGSGWETTQAMAPWVWVAAGVVALGSTLILAVEATGNFRVLLVSQSAFFAVMMIATLGLALSGMWIFLAVGVVLAAVSGLSACVFMCHRRSLLDALAWGRWLSLSLGIAVPMLVLCQAASTVDATWFTVAVPIALVALQLVTLFRFRRRIRPAARLML